VHGVKRELLSSTIKENRLKVKQKYLKGKSVFIVSLLAIGITILTIYITGVHYNRSITSNLYLSLSVIGCALFLFMAYGLYTGIGLSDDFPKFKNFRTGELIAQSGTAPDLPNIQVGDGIGGFIVSILLWIAMTILAFALLILLEVVFWFSIFIILAMLYWGFFRALKLVFRKSIDTKGKLGMSIAYAISYSFLYVGWIFALVYLSEMWR